MNAATLWEAYRTSRDPAIRDALVEQNLRLVHHVARKMVNTLSVDVEVDDLISAGTIGLINAIENFDPGRGLAFSTFAAPRIWGAILDDLRRWDHVPRSVRRKQRLLANARDTLMNTLDREPSAQETAELLGIDVETLWKWETDAQESVHISLDTPLATDDRNRTTPLDILVGDEGTTIDDRMTREEEVARLREEILALDERERLVLSLYYYEELKLHQIAAILNLTESRISQIRSQAIRTLRSRMGSLRKEAV
ncbi:MAG: FliA/WhiG family RNA polymerase sigma factor [Gemmatimonadota bacterium]|jgi:RNA polymerase sigma factor for flagellar operon FliA